MSRRPDRSSRRTPPAPGGSTGARGAVLLAIAVVLGIVLLNGFDRVPTTDSVDVDSIGDGLGTSTTAPTGGAVTVPAVTTTTRAPRAPADITVLVANGTDVKGLAGSTATALKGIGYNTLSPADTTRSVDVTKVQFSPGFDGEARAVAATLGLLPTAVEAASPSNAPPIADTLGANLVVVLGADIPRTTTAGTGTGATTSTTRR